jgi:hypothetical protein
VTELVRYDAMVSAIDAAHRVDEVADVRNRAMALQLYARQAGNTDAERKAAQIRMRAERRTGELLRVIERSDGGRPSNETRSTVESVSTPYQAALASANISPRAAHQYQALAAVPRAEFEQRLGADGVPTTQGIINSYRSASTPTPVPRMPTISLDLWGWVCDFERRRFADLDVAAALFPMTPAMRDDLRRVLPLIVLCLTEMEMENTQ